MNMNRMTLYPWPVWVVAVLIVPAMLIAVGAVAAGVTDTDTLVFDRPDLWWLGGIVPLAGLICLYGVARKRRGLNLFASRSLAPLMAQRLSPGRQAARGALFVLAMMFLIAAIIGPRWGVYLEERKVCGVDIAVALDVSRSMLAEDMAPNRLLEAKRRIREQLIDRAPFKGGNRLALIGFAGTTTLRLPLTTDRAAFRSKLEQFNVGDAPRGGTNISAAIRRSVDLFARSPEEATRVLMLLTDGEDHEGDAIAEAQTAWTEHGIRVFTIGVGDPSRTVGAQVPIETNGGHRPLLHDGQIVFSRPDVARLKQIASVAGGQYVPLEDLHHLIDAVAGMHRADLGTEERLRHRPRYQWFVAAALALLLIESMMKEVRPTVEAAPVRLWQQEAA
jgi:Ca-activated chloride channel homolog